MNFKFIGKDSRLFGLSHDKTYQILQFGIQKHHLAAYFINDEKVLSVISYSSTAIFNENWIYDE